MISIETQIGRLLRELGIRPSLTGYTYLIDAVKRRMKDPLGKITAVYQMVAKHYNAVSASAVERSIRHAIQSVTGENSTSLHWHHVFGNTAHYSTNTPTNAEFISAVANYILEEAQ